MFDKHFMDYHGKLIEAPLPCGKCKNCWRNEIEQALGRGGYLRCEVSLMPVKVAMPVTNLLRGKSLVRAMRASVIGQDEALEIICPLVDQWAVGLGPESRPAGVVLMLGPTGVGKTHTVEALAEVLHGDRGKMIFVNCGEYQAPHEISKLIGAPPGYLGHRETQPVLNFKKLSEARSNQCGLALVLFDEIEKAGPELYQLLLGVFERGELVGGDNTSTEFKDTLVFMTSNLGVKQWLQKCSTGYGFGEKTQGRMGLDQPVKAAMGKRFPPEFVNRIDKTVIYKPLDRRSLEGVAMRELEIVNTRLRKHGFMVEPTEELFNQIVAVGEDVSQGARGVRREVERRIFTPVVEMILEGQNNRAVVKIGPEGIVLGTGGGE